MKQIVLVAHGSPSDPEPQEDTMRRLAEAVAAQSPGSLIRGATLAMPGSLEGALAGLDAPIIYPFFMAEGWFTKRELPRRLKEIGVEARHMDPFGVDPALPELITQACLQAASSAGIEPESADLILTAHGSKVARKSKNSAYDMAALLRRKTPFWRVQVALIEEPPFLEDIARQSNSGICLPFFALRAGHVLDDIPDALDAARFDGELLPPIGEHPEVPALIAAAIARL